MGIVFIGINLILVLVWGLKDVKFFIDFNFFWFLFVLLELKKIGDFFGVIININIGVSLRVL